MGGVILAMQEILIGIWKGVVGKHPGMSAGFINGPGIFRHAVGKLDALRDGTMGIEYGLAAITLYKLGVKTSHGRWWDTGARRQFDADIVRLDLLQA